MQIKEFIQSKLFLRQLIIAISLGIAIIWISLKMLDLYTHHGRIIEVPDLIGMNEAEVRKAIRAAGLKYVVNDSVFDDNLPKGSMSAQDPVPGAGVKKGRTIYLTMVALMPEMVPMPDLTDLSLRQAIAMLNTYGLRLGQIEYRPDIARNAVLQQKFNRAGIEAGSLVAKGTAIDLVLGEGLGENIVLVPLLLGKTRTEAIELLNALSLNIGNEFFLDGEGASDKVFQQQPDPLKRRHFLQAGSAVDLYYRSSALFDFDSYLSELLTVALPLLFGKTPEEVRSTLETYGLLLGEEVFENGVSPADARVYRQDPEYEEDAVIVKGKTVNVWYRSVNAFDINQGL